MSKEREGWFTLRDGILLFEKIWEPSITPAAHLIFLHGFSDRCELQYNLFPTLTSHPYNFAVHAFDQRGWGKSVHNPSQRGFTGPTSQVLTDVDQYIGYVHSGIANPTSTPIFLMGHSMGGQVALHYLLTPQIILSLPNRPRISGAIIASPYIALHQSSQPWRITVTLGRIAAKLSPRTQMKQTLDWRSISRDENVGREWRDDVLCHGYGTLEGLSGMLDRAAMLERLGIESHPENGSGLDMKLQVPVFWAHGTSDRVTAFEPSKGLFERLVKTDGKLDADVKALNVGHELTLFKAYVDAYHKIHTEPDGVGIAFAQDVGDWCLQILKKLKAKNNAQTTEASLASATDFEVDEGHPPTGSVKDKDKVEQTYVDRQPESNDESDVKKVKAKL